MSSRSSTRALDHSKTVDGGTTSESSAAEGEEEGEGGMASNDPGDQTVPS